ncbi:hypothetical protein L6R50_21530 [Myxococcota bacterium]|nr:hypothetical protein [Myxococcota bacterium]
MPDRARPPSTRRRLAPLTLALALLPAAARGGEPPREPVMLHVGAGKDAIRDAIRSVRSQLGLQVAPDRVLAVEAKTAGEPGDMLLHGLAVESTCALEPDEAGLRTKAEGLVRAAATRQAGLAGALLAEGEALLAALPCADPAAASARARDALMAMGTLATLRGAPGDAEAAQGAFARALVMDPSPRRVDAGEAAISGHLHAARLELAEPRALETAALAPGSSVWLDGELLAPGQPRELTPGLHVLQLRPADGQAVRGAWVRVERSREPAWLGDPRAVLEGLPLQALPSPPRWDVVSGALRTLAPSMPDSDRVLVLRGDGTVLSIDLAQRRAQVVTPPGAGPRRGSGAVWLSASVSYGGYGQPFGGSLVAEGGGWANHSAGGSLAVGRRVSGPLALGISASFAVSAGSGPARPWLAVRPFLDLSPDIPQARPFAQVLGLFQTLAVSAGDWGGAPVALGGGLAGGLDVPFPRHRTTTLRIRGEAAMVRELARGETLLEVGADVGVAFRF